MNYFGISSGCFLRLPHEVVGFLGAFNHVKGWMNIDARRNQQMSAPEDWDQANTNILKLTIPAGGVMSGIEYDYLRLEPGSNSVKYIP